jgi:hypothetical protein
LSFELLLTNTGSMLSSKTVQLYIKQTNVPDAPLRQLSALAKVAVEPGQTVKVVLNTAEYGGVCAFCVVAEDGTSSVPTGTKFAVSVGDGATDYLTATVITAV